jgi:hypothetical protein
MKPLTGMQLTNNLKKFIEDNPKLVTMKESPAYPGLYVLKYTRKVFYTGRWNNLLENCRGTIVDKDFNIVSYPFTKIFNYGIEHNAPRVSLKTPVTAFRKVNGFMAAASMHDSLLVSTTGSLDSKYADMAKELMDLKKVEEVCSLYAWYTFMFEVVHPDDPHIIPEEAGLYLLGYRFNNWNSPIETENLENLSAKDGFDCKVPEKIETTLDELIKSIKTVKHEGYVFYTNDRVSAKLKSPYYLVSKLLARTRTDKLSKLNIKSKLDEEYYPLVDQVQKDIELFSTFSEQERLNYIREFFDASNN